MKYKFLAFFVFLLSTVHLNAQVGCIPEKPNPPRLVNDFADVLSVSTVSRLENRLVKFNDTTSTQIALVTVADLCGEEPSFFAFELGEKWKVGNEKFDNGIVVLFKPKQPNSKGEVFIATGYGLEGVLPDAIGKRIVENEMIPYFRNGQVEQGLLNGIETIIEITGGEYSAENYNKNGRGKGEFPFAMLAMLIVFIGLMLFKNIGRARKYAQRNDTSLWMALWLMGSVSSNHRGSYGNFSGGKGGFGGFGGGSGGGGFGGFGGGSFGGGGAGGSW